MSIKRKIWALPVVSAVIFGLGLAVSAYLSTAALNSIHATESADYPVLDMAKSLTLDLAAVGDGLRDAVSEGDKERIGQVDGQAVKLRAKFAPYVCRNKQVIRQEVSCLKNVGSGVVNCCNKGAWVVCGHCPC